MTSVLPPFLFLFLIFAWPALAEEGRVSFIRGKELFDDQRLGTTGKSCATCHAGGKIIKDKAIFVDDILAGNVNAGITMELMGTPLDPGSDDMKSLIIYIKSFAPRPGMTLDMSPTGVTTSLDRGANSKDHK